VSNVLITPNVDALLHKVTVFLDNAKYVAVALLAGVKLWFLTPEVTPVAGVTAPVVVYHSMTKPTPGSFTLIVAPVPEVEHTKPFAAPVGLAGRGLTTKFKGVLNVDKHPARVKIETTVIM
jgi:hypothetical protein